LQPPHLPEHEAVEGSSGVFFPVARFNTSTGESRPIAANNKASSSQPAIAAAKRKFGVKSTGGSTPRVVRLTLGVFGSDSLLDVAALSLLCPLALSPPAREGMAPAIPCEICKIVPHLMGVRKQQQAVQQHKVDVTQWLLLLNEV